MPRSAKSIRKVELSLYLGLVLVSWVYIELIILARGNMDLCVYAHCENILTGVTDG